jgi:hypothetical protein
LSLARSITSAAFVAFLLKPSPASAQKLPRLDPVPVAPALAEFEFRVNLAPPLVVHSSGCIATFDTDASQVVCIDPVSGATRRFGRNGAGPGEFASVNGVIPSPDGGLIAFDVIRNLRFTLIARDWTLARIVPMTHQFMGLYRPTRDSVLTIGGTLRQDLVAVSLQDGGTAMHFSPTAPESAIFKGPGEYDFYGFWLVPLHRGGWYVASPYQYRILHEDEHGKVLSSFGRDVPRELPTERELRASRALMQRANPSMNLDQFMERYRKTQKLVIQRAPAEDGQDRLWVVTGRARADSTEVDVFDPRGGFLGTRRIPGDVHALCVQGADLYVLVEYLSGEHEGAQGVLHYRIR